VEQDDQEGVRTVDDDNFIDDTGVDPADRYGSDNERHSPGRYAQVLFFIAQVPQSLFFCTLLEDIVIHVESNVHWHIVSYFSCVACQLL
jgi:hypothetical protein